MVLVRVASPACWFELLSLQVCGNCCYNKFCDVHDVETDVCLNGAKQKKKKGLFRKITSLLSRVKSCFNAVMPVPLLLVVSYFMSPAPTAKMSERKVLFLRELTSCVHTTTNKCCCCCCFEDKQPVQREEGASSLRLQWAQKPGALPTE